MTIFKPLIDRMALLIVAMLSIGASSAMAQTPLPGGQIVLTEIERDGLRYMFKEEKLAFGVYTALAKKFGKPFSNILGAEKAHMAAVKVLLNKYNLEIPSSELAPTKFENTNLQQLYDRLVKQGNTSRTEALKVGALIEELDIFDLEKHLAATTNSNLISAYRWLQLGSRNHLRAFIRNLSRARVNYKPQYLSQKEFDKIIGSPVERGISGSGQ